MTSSQVDPLTAESKAVEEGAYARLQNDGSFLVRAATRAGWSWTVSVGLVPVGGFYAIKFSCNCESGTARPSSLLSCWHAALVGRRLERTGWARWETGVWWATDKAISEAGLDEPTPTKLQAVSDGHTVERCDRCHHPMMHGRHTNNQKCSDEALGR